MRSQAQTLPVRVIRIVAWCGFGLVISGNGRAQAQLVSNQSAADIVRSFASRSGQETDLHEILVGCGHSADDARNRTVAKSLVNGAAASIPEIEQAFHSIEERGQQSEFASNASWLLHAYAVIRGAAANVLFREMTRNPALTFLHSAIDDSAALALGLTSFVSRSRTTRTEVLCRRDEPRDALNRLMIAWNSGDYVSVQSSLGPIGQAELHSLVKASNWEHVRSELGYGRSIGPGVGYHFAVAGEWSQPEETLRGPSEGPELFSTNPELETQFRSSSGIICGNHRVRFLRTQEIDRTSKYLVDDPTLLSILRTISYCGGIE